MMIDDPIVRIQHVRAARLCTRGARQWFQSRNLDFSSFLKDGMPASELEALGDALADRVVLQARADAQRGGK